ncbi:MAG TPA: DUF721 domain-containing protein [Smithellaceae bacterium]|nr:DUF721 domain-containing protein [Smithellaceae bacterium]HRS82542.1 DUF721 domain-containing protein [Smithellaceae bacterium]HRV44031.1 DUF721 domain-containing protein [Smithellaceae bacterium]
MKRKSFKGQLQPVGEILSAVLKQRGLTGKLTENPVFKLWPKAVGTRIAQHTCPDGWRAGTLFVKTTSSVWVQQLHFMKEDILKKINDLAGRTAVREIRFAVGYDPPRRDAGMRAVPSGAALKERDKRIIAECTDAIKDRELAAIVKRVMQAEISRRRIREKRQDR